MKDTWTHLGILTQNCTHCREPLKPLISMWVVDVDFYVIFSTRNSSESSERIEP